MGMTNGSTDSLPLHRSRAPSKTTLSQSDRSGAQSRNLQSPRAAAVRSCDPPINHRLRPHEYWKSFDCATRCSGCQRVVSSCPRPPRQFPGDKKRCEHQPELPLPRGETGIETQPQPNTAIRCDRQEIERQAAAVSGAFFRLRGELRKDHRPVFGNGFHAANGCLVRMPATWSVSTSFPAVLRICTSASRPWPIWTAAITASINRCTRSGSRMMPSHSNSKPFSSESGRMINTNGAVMCSYEHFLVRDASILFKNRLFPLYFTPA